jgi:hypothetical protein
MLSASLIEQAAAAANGDKSWVRPALEHERMRGLLRRHVRERDARDVPFFAAKARPEYRIDQRFNDIGRRQRGQMLLAFLPMYFVAVAYCELNKAEPDCGTTFTWAARAFGPKAGWMGGWGIIAADIIVMANLAQIAGSYSFRFAGDLGLGSAVGLADDVFWSTVAGVARLAGAGDGRDFESGNRRLGRWRVLDSESERGTA